MKADRFGFDVEEICFQGPKERLDATLCTQPILFIIRKIRVAVFRIFRSDLIHRVGAQEPSHDIGRPNRVGNRGE